NGKDMTDPRRHFDRLQDAIDRYQRRHHFAGFIHAVIRKYMEDEAGHRAALLAYYGFLSFFPLLLVLTTLLKLLLLGNSSFGQHVIQGATAYFPVIGEELQHDVHGIGKTGMALVLGILVALFGARGVADVLRSSFDHIWQVPHGKRLRWP